jgi:hypothetical protein
MQQLMRLCRLKNKSQNGVTEEMRIAEVGWAKGIGAIGVIAGGRNVFLCSSEIQ